MLRDGIREPWNSLRDRAGYRAEETIGTCLEAFFAAGFAREEIVVVDDGSPDGTVEATAVLAVLWLHYLVAGAGYARVRLLG